MESEAQPQQQPQITEPPQEQQYQPPSQPPQESIPEPSVMDPPQVQQQQQQPPSSAQPSEQKEEQPQEEQPNDIIPDPIIDTNTFETAPSYPSNNDNTNENNNINVNNSSNEAPANMMAIEEEIPNPNISPIISDGNNELNTELADSIPNPDIQIDDNIDDIQPEEEQPIIRQQQQEEQQEIINNIQQEQQQEQKQPEQGQELVNNELNNEMNDQGPNLPPDIPEDSPQQHNEQPNDQQDIQMQPEMDNNNAMMVDHVDTGENTQLQAEPIESEMSEPIISQPEPESAQGENTMNIEPQVEVEPMIEPPQMQQQQEQNEIKQMPEPMETDNIPQNNSNNTNNSNNNNSTNSVLPELVQCRNLLTEFISRPESEPFNEPVDWKGLNLPDYPLIITKPMDLGSVLTKLNNNKYKGADQFASDVRLVFKNAKSYNMVGSGIYVVAENLLKQFERRYARITKINGNKRRKTSDKLKNGVESTYEKRTQFTNLVQQLQPKELGGVVELIDKKAPYALNDTNNNDEELEIQVYHIDGNTLNDLITHMQKVINKRRK